MEKPFLEELGLSEAQQTSVLQKVQQEMLEEKLRGAGVRSVEAAKGVLNNTLPPDTPLDRVIADLKQAHPYLFESAEPIFSGPAGGEEDERQEEKLRRALGLC